jgi:hypothetical protein
MHQIDLCEYDDPFYLVSWLIKNMGNAGGRWDILELQYISFKRDMDFTFFNLLMAEHHK